MAACFGLHSNFTAAPGREPVSPDSQLFALCSKDSVFNLLLFAPLALPALYVTFQVVSQALEETVACPIDSDP